MYNNSTITFTKEQQLAFHTFMLCIGNWRKYLIPQLPHYVPPNNTIYITPQVTKRIIFDSEAHWKWNRGNEIEVPKQFLDFKISFVKYTSRTKKRNNHHPGYKVWIFYINDIVTYEEFSFIWIVKGNNQSNIPTFNEMYATCTFSETLIEKLNKFTGLPIQDTEEDYNICDNNEIRLSDYNFLKAFISPNLAKEFGWTS